MSRWAVAALLLALAPGPVAGQLSPGKLSAPHAGLEGVGSCTRCHDLGRGPSPAKCLGCHGPIAERIAAGRGLHARPGHEECAACHSEHHGRDYALVHWPQGREAFDHEQAGFGLAGRHARLGCRECHGRRFAGLSDELRTAGLDPERSFLGLTSSCAACHPDPHGGGLDPDCRTCHSQAAWRPAAGFDHARSGFPLTGLHARVDCARCHRPAATGGKGALRFTGLPHGRCSDCHRDPHDGRLGAACESCHATSGWKAVAASAFDHAKTRFPLRGRHRQVDCAACHRPGQPRSPLPHARCADCHADHHGAGAAGRPRLLDCEGCHGESGWRPSTFTLARHERADYPLQGAHLAVPCDGCHRPGRAVGEDPAVFALRLPHAGCASCHRDPHEARLGRFAAEEGCAGCHEAGGWSPVSFDHARTGFPLEGRHAAASCRGCHTIAPGEATGSDPVPKVGFERTAKACEACHPDIHRGQFAKGAEGRTDCAGCHSPAGWRPAAFDHQSCRYPLDGAHRGVACAGCHPSVSDERGSYAKYKPLGTACADCHGARGPEGRKEGS